jgi:hypothetical protein
MVKFGNVVFFSIILSFLLNAPEAAAATRTQLTINSQPGDFVGGGRSYSYSATGNKWVVEASYEEGIDRASLVRFSIFNDDRPERWFLTFSSGQLNRPLTPGEYPDAQSPSNVQPGHPAFGASGNGAGCQGTGQFAISDAQFDYSYGYPILKSFAATFEQRCLGSTATLSGSIYYNYNTNEETGSITGQLTDLFGNGLGSVGVLLSGPTKSIAFTDANGRYSFSDLFFDDQYTVTPLTSVYGIYPQSQESRVIMQTQSVDFLGVYVKPPNALTELRVNSDLHDVLGSGEQFDFSQNEGSWMARADDLTGNGLVDKITIVFRNTTSNEEWSLTFDTLPLGTDIAVGEYPRAARSQFAPTGGIAGLAVNRNQGGCNQLTGSFVIGEVQIDYSSGTPQLMSFAASFEQHCEGAIAALRGSIYYNYFPKTPYFKSPFITSISRSGKHIVLTGLNYDADSEILVDGQTSKTRFSGSEPNNLIGKKLFKRIQPGQTVRIRIRNSDGTLSNEVTFSRPAE